MLLFGRMLFATLATVGTVACLGVAGPKVEPPGRFRVGHRLWHLTHTGVGGERRPLDVHLWYPADEQLWAVAPTTVYRSPLHGVPLLPGRYEALSYEVASPDAREDVDLERGRSPFPVLIFSHGSGSSTIGNFSVLGEQVASHGVVVAAPVHLSDTFEDLRVDFVNNAAGQTMVPCPDALSPPCFDGGAVMRRNRLRDTSYLIDELARAEGVFRGRIDPSRLGLLGFSRGGSLGLQLVAGNPKLGTLPEKRIQALMTLGTVAPLTDEVLAGISVPLLLVSGTHDTTTPSAISERVFNAATGTRRTHVAVRGARHRTFASGACRLVQAVGAVASVHEKAMERTMLDEMLKDTTAEDATSRAAGRTDSVLDYCPYETFVGPVDLRPIVRQLSGYEITETSVPRHAGVPDVTRLVASMAVTFFGSALGPGDPLRLPADLTPEHLLKQHSDLIATAVGATPNAAFARPPALNP